ncbi:MAG: hypothetical protein HY319_28775 [Armatimonadetes bacterium]|nr:hypothetical protein [Armatimonadota bacterium]
MSRMFQAGARLVLTLAVGAMVWACGPAVVAQEAGGGEASESITITEEEGAEKPAAGESKPAVTPLNRAKIKISDRDPFRNPIASGEVHETAISKPAHTVRPAAAPAGTASKPAQAAPKAGSKPAAAAEEAEPEVAAPAVTVTGIVMSGGSRRAILTSPDQSYIVGVGDKLAEYRVSAITDHSVTFKVGDNTFTLEIEDQWGLRD